MSIASHPLPSVHDLHLGPRVVRHGLLVSIENKVSVLEDRLAELYSFTSYPHK